jgi:hypothetical protein
VNGEDFFFVEGGHGQGAVPQGAAGDGGKPAIVAPPLDRSVHELMLRLPALAGRIVFKKPS